MCGLERSGSCVAICDWNVSYYITWDAEAEKGTAERS